MPEASGRNLIDPSQMERIGRIGGRPWVTVSVAQGGEAPKGSRTW